jgi:hypothetical protein
VSPVSYEIGSYIPEDGIFIVTAVKTSTLTRLNSRFCTAAIGNACKCTLLR